MFDASEGSTEWEAKTYKMGPNDLSFDVTLPDPIDLDLDAHSHSIVLKRDARGFPLEYRMFLRTGVCLDGTCKLLEATLFWDALGRFVRFEYPQGTPFTKMEHDPFDAADYEKLHSFMADPAQFSARIRWTFLWSNTPKRAMGIGMPIRVPRRRMRKRLWSRARLIPLGCCGAGCMAKWLSSCSR